jgi:hypothetical protein
MEPLIFFLNSHQAGIMVDALVAFANQCEAEGDVCGVAPICDELAKRLRELCDLDRTEWIEVAKTIGLGKFKHRPQG